MLERFYFVDISDNISFRMLLTYFGGVRCYYKLQNHSLSVGEVQNFFNFGYIDDYYIMMIKIPVNIDDDIW